MIRRLIAFLAFGCLLRATTTPIQNGVLSGTTTITPFTNAGIVTNSASGVLTSSSNAISVNSTLMGLLGTGWSNSTSLFLRADGSWASIPATATGHDPTATLGLTAVVGTALTFLRSDGAPALSQSIVPTWTGLHTFASTTGSYLEYLQNTNGGSYGLQQWGLAVSGSTGGFLIQDVTGTAKGMMLARSSGQPTFNYFGTAGPVLTSSAGLLTSTANLSVPFGGTGAASFTANNLITGNGSSSLQASGWTISGGILQTNNGAQLVDSTGSLSLISNNSSSTITLNAQTSGSIINKIAATTVGTWISTGLGIGIASPYYALSIEHTASSALFSIGQDSTHLLFTEWSYNATAGSAFALIGTFGQNNKIQFQASAFSFDTTSVAADVQFFGNGDVVIGGGGDLSAVFGVNGTTNLTGVLTLGAAFVQLKASSTIDEIGQDSTHYLYLEWNYNATPGSANAQIGTFGKTNPVTFDAAGFTFDTTAGAGQFVVAAGGDTWAGGGSDPGSPLGVNGNFITTGTIATGGGAGWKITAVNSVSPTAQNRTFTFTYNGTTYYLTGKTSND